MISPVFFLAFTRSGRWSWIKARCRTQPDCSRNYLDLMAAQSRRARLYISRIRAMSMVIDRVLRTLNAHDLEAFVDCYSPVALIEDGGLGVLAQGHLEIRNRYAKMFATFPLLRVDSLSRWEVGAYVAQEEQVSGRTSEIERHIAIYLVTDGVTVRERLFR
jgi:hypothetical protein